MSHAALARSIQHRVEVRCTPYLPTGTSTPAGDGDGAQGAGVSPQAKPSEPGQALAGFPVASLGSADAGPSVQVAKEDMGEYWDWVGHTFLPLGRQKLSLLNDYCCRIKI